LLEQHEVSEDCQRRFDQAIRSNINESKYNALLLLSGGKDSAYILHRIRLEYPELKVLCAIVNNGFMSPVAISNATYLAAKLKTDLVIISSHVDEFAKVLRRAFLDLKGRGSYSIVDYADGDLIFKIGKQVACDMKIPLVIGGLSWVQVQRILGSDDFQIIEEGKPKTIFPLVVWRENEQTIRATVRSLELLPKGTDSPIISNSTLALTMSAVDVLNLGCCSFEPEFAQLVREGKTDRKTWLHLFELLEFAPTRGFLSGELERNLQKMNLSLADIIGAK
jgi:hypothetical protein